MHRRFQFLFEHSVPAFGQWTTWLLLCFALYLAVLPFEPVQGIHPEKPATIFGLLPLSLLTAGWFYEVVRWVLIFGSLAWMFHRSIPASCWITCFAFTLLWSLRMENSDHGSQMLNVTTMLLFIHAAWFHFYHRSIQQARRDKQYRTTPLYPRWVFLVSVFYIGWFHTLGGLTKISHSGLDWGNGLSLQLWILQFGRDNSTLNSLLLENRTLAAILQSAFLIVTLISIFAVINRWVRLAIGILLLLFYAGLMMTFVDFGFFFNAVLVAIFFLPVEPYMNRMKRGNEPNEDHLQ